MAETDMNVLMLGWELPPHNSGGLGVACYQLSKALADQGANITFVLPFQFDHNIDFMNVVSAQPVDVAEVVATSIAYDSYKYIFTDGSSEILDIYNQQLRYAAATLQIAEALEFDVIHAHDWLTFESGLKVKSMTGKPLIVHVHSLEHDRAGGKVGNPLVHDIEQAAFDGADRIIAVSNQTKNAIVQNYGIDPDKISVLHNSIDLKTVGHLDYSNSFKYLNVMKRNGYKVVANIGRLTIQKGLTNLIHAVQMVVSKQPKTIFLISGSGEQYYELIELAASLGVSRNVIFTGFLQGKQLRDAFAAADLFVMPSISEPFGLTPLEAAGYGVPSVVSKQSGVSEVLRNCLKVDYWDIQKMADLILAVTTEPALHKELRRNAFKEYVQLSWHKTASELLKQYKQQVEAVL